jgi:cell division protein FtsI/penicillin-binding protein 2
MLVMRLTRRLAVLLAVPLLLAGLVACSHQPSPDPAVNAFLDGWRTGQFKADLSIVSADGAGLTGADVAGKIKTLGGDLADLKPTLKAGKAKVNKNDATAPIDVSWPVAAGTAWAYQTTLRLTFADGKWKPIWEPSVFAAQVTDGDKLKLKTTDAPRGEILDGAGQPIFSNQKVVDVGVVPKNVKDINGLVKALGDAFKSVKVTVELADLPARVQAAKSDEFVEVVLLRDATYQQIRPRIHDLDGTSFHEGIRSLGRTQVFARALLGQVSEVNKERMDAQPGRFQLGDLVGYGGLQEKYDDRLRGSAGVIVSIAPKAGTTDAEKILFHADAAAGKSLKTTIDTHTQEAADGALAGVAKPAAIVAIRVSDGSLLAVANGPGPANLNLAFGAQVAPGSTFKSVTATHVLETGQADANTPVECTAKVSVGGREFGNVEGEHLGTFPLHQNFAQSCNTAFARLYTKLGPTGLHDTAAKLGIGIPWGLGIDAFTGKVSVNESDVDRAAAAFGQGTTLVSPVAMAGCAAALARGQWKQPHLLTDPAPAKPAADQAPLKPGTVDAMHQMMREVVTSGTASSLASAPGAPVSGKTGTAEFDNANPARTHSWFIGFRGDVAFAVFVQEGGLSTAAAVPIAGNFFKLLG